MSGLSAHERESIARALRDLELVSAHTGPVRVAAIERQYSDLTHAMLRELIARARARGYTR